MIKANFLTRLDGDGIPAGRADDVAFVLASGVVELDVDLVQIEVLAAQVDVAGAGFHARRHHPLPVEVVGADAIHDLK